METTPGRHSAEKETNLRFSLAYEPLGNRDYYLTHISGEVRFVEYPNPGKYRLQLRESLLRRGLILGVLQSEDEDEQQAFRVPLSARPLGYDSSSHATGTYTYDDTRLFFDLGNVLGQIGRADPIRPNVLRGDIGRMLAIVEFTHVGERRLQLVPGAEIMLFPLADKGDVQAYYSEELKKEFGNVFLDAEADFHVGFELAMTGTPNE